MHDADKTLDQAWELLDIGDLAEARARAEPLTRSDDELEAGEAWVVLADAALAEGHDDIARQALARIEALDDDPDLLVHAGNLAAALDELDRASSWFETAAEIDPDMADAHYGLGWIHQARGELAQQIDRFQRVRLLDAAEPRLPWGLSEDEFAELAEAALAELPEAAISRLENVPILIDDAPSAELVAEGIDPRLLGLFSGLPLPEKSHEGQSPALDSIHLFQRNLESAAEGREELLEEIRITVLHETAHFFGLEDHDLHELGLG
jgi:predicted Zn-dependent protease with MMP-like domain